MARGALLPSGEFDLGNVIWKFDIVGDNDWNVEVTDWWGEIVMA